MRSLQQRLQDEFERIANDHDCELVQQAHWGNTGQWLALKHGEPYKVVARVHYDIQSGISKLWFNDADSLKPWLDKGTSKARRNPDVFYFNPTEQDRVNAAFARWGYHLTH